MRIHRSAFACLVLAACRTNAAAPPFVEDAEAQVVDVVDVLPEASVDARRDAPREAAVVRFAAPFACELRAVQVTRGQHVTRGTRLALLAPLDAPYSSLRHAEAELLAAERTYARMKMLYDLGEPKRDLDDAESRLRSATAEVARLRTPEIVRAPVDGIVLSVPTACKGNLFALRPDEQSH